MASQELVRATSVPAQPAEMQLWISPEQVRARIAHVHQIYKELMQEGTHFGTVPGAAKKSLWKPGSEILLSTFRISVDPIVEDLSVEDEHGDVEEIRFRVRCIAYDQNKRFLGAGVGEASSSESKYKWREAVCQEEWRIYDELGRARRHWKRGQREAYEVFQVRQDPADVANTVLKMAKKRAQIDLTLTVTACSDIFTQDIDPDDPDTAGNTETGSADEQFEDPRAGASNVDPSKLMSKCAKHGLYKGDACAKCEAERRPEPRTIDARETAPRQTAEQQRSRSGKLPADYQKITEGQAKRFFAIWKERGYTRTEISGYLKKRWGIDTDRDIPAADYDEAIAYLEGR